MLRLARRNKIALGYRAQLTFAVVVFANQSVAGVPLLVPVTLTVMYLPWWVDVSVRVVFVCPLMAWHVLGTV